MHIVFFWWQWPVSQKGHILHLYFCFGEVVTYSCRYKSNRQLNDVKHHLEESQKINIKWVAKSSDLCGKLGNQPRNDKSVSTSLFWFNAQTLMSIKCVIDKSWNFYTFFSAPSFISDFHSISMKRHRLPFHLFIHQWCHKRPGPQTQSAWVESTLSAA